MKNKEIPIIKSKLEQMSLTIYQIVDTVIQRIISSEETHFNKRILKYTVFRLHLPSGNYFKNKITTKIPKLHSFLLFLIIILVLFWNWEREKAYFIKFKDPFAMEHKQRRLNRWEAELFVIYSSEQGLTHRPHRELITARDKIAVSWNCRGKTYVWQVGWGYS